jgi:hypothetical protein
MIEKNTNSEPLQISRDVRGSIQTGSIPAGVTAGDSKYPVNISNVISGQLNNNPTLHVYIPVEEVYANFSIKVDGDWSNPIKPGVPVIIKRGAIKNSYVVKKTVFDTVSLKSIISFDLREDNVSFDCYLSGVGYPSAANDVFVLFNKSVENPNQREKLLRSFDVEMVPTLEDFFTVNVSWDIDPKIKATKLRWRSIPRVKNTSYLDFIVLNIGLYTQAPSAEVISDTGRSAKISLSGSIDNVHVGSPGAGYTIATAQVSGGGGTGADITPNISGSNTITGFSIVNPGYGYTSQPEITISGDGIGANVSGVDLLIDTVSVVDQGGGYLTSPTVVLDDTYAITPGSVQSTLYLQNEGEIDYVRVLDGGTGYTGASVSVIPIGPSGAGASAEAIIENGVIKYIKVLDGGTGYTGASVSIIPAGPSGTGASVKANIDLYSEWVYENAIYEEKQKSLSGFKTNVPYEIQILTSSEEFFRGNISYSDSLTFQYTK